MVLYLTLCQFAGETGKMANFFRKIGRIMLALFGISLNDNKYSAITGRQAVENMKSRFAQIRTSAAKVVANECRIERMLDAEKKILESDDSERQRARIADLEAQLESARRSADEAREQLDLFRDELQRIQNRERDAELEYQLSSMRAQVEKLTLGASFDENLAAIERTEHRANLAKAEAEALAELNEALGHKNNGNPVQETNKEQRITESMDSERGSEI